MNQQVAIITGSTKGIGREIALAFAQAGYAVVVHGMDAARAKAVCDEIGAGTACFLGDVSKSDTAEGLVQTALDRFGRLDVLINNAGTPKMEPFLEFTQNTWQEGLNVHMSGAFFCGQAAARAMVRQRSGRILNVSSIASQFGQFGFASYASVKAGVEALTRVMAVELAQYNITVNCLSPGPVWNDMMEHLYGIERLKERARTIPVGRMTDAKEVAAAALFLASPEAGTITGQVLRIDGGASAAGPYTLEVFKRAAASQD